MSFQCELNNVYLENSILNNLAESKFLGIYIDKRLKFEPHIEQLCSKLSTNCYALRVISGELDHGTAKKSYFALIESHLRYGICFWGTCSKYLFLRVFVLQKRALRSVCRAGNGVSCKPLFLKERILTLTSLFILETVSLLHSKFRNHIRDIQNPYNVRQSHRICLPIPTSSRVRDSVVYSSRKIFNHLPLEIRQIYDRKKFKMEVKRLLAVRAYYGLNEYFAERF